MIENEPFHDIITLYSDVRRMQIREGKSKDKGDKDRVIRRRASDDAGWW